MGSQLSAFEREQRTGSQMGDNTCGYSICGTCGTLKYQSRKVIN